MELKYYLRGLGLGIVVTAIIMGLTTSKNRTMTDAEIIARAKQLGMTEERTLKDTVADEDADAGEDALNNVSGIEPAGENALENEAENALTVTAPQDENENNDQIQMPEEEIDEADANPGMNRVESDNEQTADDAETGSDTAQSTTGRTNAPMVITIGSGDGSYAVSRKLADVGAVSSAENFDTFLCQNGYDKRIRTGTYTIPEGASNEQMARIITGAE